MIRQARLSDIPDLIELEIISFDTDRLSRRNFRYLLSRANALTLVFLTGDTIVGYIMFLFNGGTSLARLYSLAVKPSQRGRGYARALIQAGEKAVLERDCVAIRLEVKEENNTARSLYEHLGYSRIGFIHNYYEDHAAAIRYEKYLAPHLTREMVPVPFYAQTLDFTCGPSALMMAMAALGSEEEVLMNRTGELQLWREATYIFMTSGHGGCDPFGLAVAAHRRGFMVEVFVSERGPLFINSVRSSEKREVLHVVYDDFMAQVKEREIPVHYRYMQVAELVAMLDRGSVPVVLISSYRIYREKAPHWVVVTGYDERFLYVHDSFLDEERNRSETDCINMPILKKDFERMARYGKSGLKAAVILSRR